MSNQNFIHPTAIVAPSVTLGLRNYIGPYCVIQGNTEIGDDNVFFSHVSVGAPAQHKKLIPQRLGDLFVPTSVGKVTIGSKNTFREFVTIHEPFVGDTVINSDCYFMVYSHISHDSIIEEGAIICNNVQLGGHSVIMRNAIIGLSSTVAQYRVVGSYSMVGMSSSVNKNIFPFSKTLGLPNRRIGVNAIGLERAGFNQRQIAEIEEFSQNYSAEAPSSLEGIPMEFSAEINRYNNYVSKRAAHIT